MEPIAKEEKASGGGGGGSHCGYMAMSETIYTLGDCKTQLVVSTP